ncbi:MAG: hypothetical protein O7A08_07265 [SAR324 cluster bacterium]|nr:hypothetical protein [SAR324 cluster bacterium]MCZ6532749.1 hypothetical protein [SAR324 cluster bacterium]MCZ6556892.1 hypothetical protein [SAR324 cluster bacterium]MCZ6728839.1 hypothetical protein [SAR324 cluster bacterium]
MKRTIVFATLAFVFAALTLLQGSILLGGETGRLPENEQVKIVAAVLVDCYVYQADCLRVTVMCKRFIPLGRPILEVSWHDADGSAFYTAVKHIAGTAHCNKGDLIHRYVPFYEGKRYTITLR